MKVNNIATLLFALLLTAASSTVASAHGWHRCHRYYHSCCSHKACDKDKKEATDMDKEKGGKSCCHKETTYSHGWAAQRWANGYEEVKNDNKEKMKK